MCLNLYHNIIVLLLLLFASLIFLWILTWKLSCFGLVGEMWVEVRLGLRRLGSSLYFGNSFSFNGLMIHQGLGNVHQITVDPYSIQYKHLKHSFQTPSSTTHSHQAHINSIYTPKHSQTNTDPNLSQFPLPLPPPHLNSNNNFTQYNCLMHLHQVYH